MSDNQKKLLHEIQCVEFACIGTQALFDTHPCNAGALADFNACSCRLRKLLTVTAANTVLCSETACN